MSDITVLHIGIKYWPYDSSIINNPSLKGIRGGGMNKYCDLLIKSLPEDVKTIIICQKIHAQKKEETCNGVTVYRVNSFGNRAVRQIITNIKSFFIGLKLIKNGKIDVIHGHLLIGISISYVLGKICKKPVIGTPYSFTTIQLSYFPNKIAKFIDSHIYGKIDTIVFESNENRDKALHLRGLSLPNSIVIHTGIPVQPPKVEIKDNPVINLLFIGRLVKIKAIDNLILSFLCMHSDILDHIHLHIAGEGELYNELSDLIKTNDLKQFITLHGYIDDSTDFFRNCEIFILPSHQEGLSISLLEAMSYGLACIVNNFGVPFPKGTVYEMANNSPKTIANAISELISNKKLIAQLSVNGRNEIEKNYSDSKFAHEYYIAYRNLVNQ